MNLKGKFLTINEFNYKIKLIMTPLASVKGREGNLSGLPSAFLI